MEAYRTGKHIGEGAHGVVLLAHHIESGKPVALKKVCYHGYRHTTSTHTTDTASNAGHANLNHPTACLATPRSMPRVHRRRRTAFTALVEVLAMCPGHVLVMCPGLCVLVMCPGYVLRQQPR